METQAALQAGVQHLQAGRFGEAERIYRNILAGDPGDAVALHLLGATFHQAGRAAEGEPLVRQAIAARPDYVEAHNTLGNIVKSLNRLDEAVGAYTNALRLRPGYAVGHYNLANALRAQGNLEAAACAYQTAIRCKPDYADAYYNLGNLRVFQEKYDLAVAPLIEAIRQRPQFAGAYSTLGSTFYQIGKLDEAVASCREAIRLQPDLAVAFGNLGVALEDQGRLTEATDAFARAIQLDPDDAVTRWNQSLHFLLQGDFKRGFAAHEESRWKRKSADTPRTFSRPRWDGAALDGRIIFLHVEEGLGDMIHFARFVSAVKDRDGNIVLECWPQLLRLFRTLPGSPRLISHGERVPEFDVECPMMSLPFALGIGNELPPAPMPYLAAEASLRKAWQERLSIHPHAQGGRLKVGLVWAGRPAFKNDRTRSIPLATFIPLADVAGVEFYSLQKGEAARQIAGAGSLRLTDYTSELQDFADTAALISELDLIISVDTAVCHLTGALGKPVWILLPFAPDWRWGIHRPDTPWYPTARLFRQEAIGDWDKVIRNVADALGRYTVCRPSATASRSATSCGLV